MSDTAVEKTFASTLEEIRNGDPIIVPHVIGGKQYLDGPLIEREDPTDPSRIITGCHDAPADLVKLAVDTSRAAQREWQDVPLAERIAKVRRGIDYIIENTADWTVRVALEIGKNETMAKAEAAETLEFARWYPDFVEVPGAVSEDRLTPTEFPVEAVLRPYGVFAAITPFNYPIALSAGPAIAAVLMGNGVVIKTSHLAPWCGQASYELFEAMDLPTGLVNVVHGGDEPGKALVASDIDGVSFVGSAEVGATIIRQMAAGPYLRPVIAEMGGKNPVIVTDTADLEAAADGIVFSAFDLAGQKCSALSRVLVTPGAHDRLVELVVERAKGIRMGDPANPDSYAGPLINAEAVQRYDRVVAAAKEAGFDVVGGERPDDGSYVAHPVVISGLPEDHDLARTEHFLPLVTISRVDSFEAALSAANAVPLGLTAGIYTGDKEEARRFLRDIEAGCINVNIPGHSTTGWWPGNHTFGGWKGSGSTGKQAYGKWYVQQFAREQSRKVSPELKELLAD
jgi:1-pyrroline-5-carboxylate dehydrogenase